MIERIRGTVESIDDGGLVLGTGGLSIRLLASRNLTSRLVPGRVEDLPVQLVVQMEGSRVLPICIAFDDEVEREVFEALVSVSGVGARAAVKALARPASEIASAVVAGDERFLSTLPGIGRARARQIIAALQEKLSRTHAASAPPGDAASLARLVLAQLGINPSEADVLVSRAAETLGEASALESSDLVREAMRIRNRR